MAIQYKLIGKRSPMDKIVRFYAIAVYGKTYNLSQLVKLLAARSTTASEGDTFSVLIGLRDLMKEILDRSERVHIDGIGTFEVVISSEGAADMDTFHCLIPSLLFIKSKLTNEQYQACFCKQAIQRVINN